MRFQLENVCKEKKNAAFIINMYFHKLCCGLKCKNIHIQTHTHTQSLPNLLS